MVVEIDAERKHALIKGVICDEQYVCEGPGGLFSVIFPCPVFINFSGLFPGIFQQPVKGINIQVVPWTPFDAPMKWIHDASLFESREQLLWCRARQFIQSAGMYVDADHPGRYC